MSGALKTGVGVVDRPVVTRLRTRMAADSGFTLVETLTALTLAGMLFLALAGVLAQALKSTVFARQSQQAIDLTSKSVEQIRSLDLAQVGMNAADAATDSNVTAGKYTVRLSDGTTRVEDIVSVATTPLSPHVTTTTIDGTTYQVARYVTRPASDAAVPGSSYVRLTVDVSWSYGNATHHKLSSTYLSQIRRGLPQPRYDFAWTGSTLAAQPAGVTANRGTVLTVSVNLTNRGARDRWNLTTVAKDTANTVRPWDFAWYNDNGPGAEACNGVRDADELTRMDPNLDGIADTGTIDTDRNVCLTATRTIPLTESTSPAVVNLTVTATSNAVASVSSQVTTKVTVANQSCTSCTYRSVFLKTSPAGQPVPTTADLPATTAATGNASLFPYSSEIDSAPGRLLQRGGAVTDTAPLRVANWRYSSPTACSTAAGTVYVNLYAVPADLSPDSPGGLSVQLRYGSGASGAWTNWGSPVTVQQPSWGYSTFAATVVAVPVPALSLPANSRIEVRVAAPNAANPDMRLAYDAPGTDSLLQLPVVSGC